MASKYLSVSPPASKPPSMHDSARGSPEPIDGFQKLVEDINSVLGPCNGIDSAGIDVEELKRLMEEYTSNEADWDRYAFADHSRGYTRNLIDNCNGKSNLLILVWTPGKGSPIHDHANAHCVMKVLKGRLNETLYAWPCQHNDSLSNNQTPLTAQCPSTDHKCSFTGAFEPAALQIRRDTIYQPDQVTYMSDRLGLHRVMNPSDTEVAISLHLYTPPNAAKHGCHIFDESTGKKSHVSQCHFYSEFGVKL